MFGGEFSNDEGGSLLDDRSDFLALWFEGEATLEDNDLDHPMYSATIPLPSEVPEDVPILLCVQPGDRLVNGGTEAKDPPDDRTIVSVTMSSTVSTSLPYKVFVNYGWAADNLTLTGNHGMQLFSADGSVVYDSRIPEGKLHDTVKMNIPVGTSTEPDHKSHEYKEGAFYAVSMYPSIYYQEQHPAGDDFSYMYTQMIKQPDGSSVKAEWYLFDESIPFIGMSYGSESFDIKMMILDDTAL